MNPLLSCERCGGILSEAFETGLVYRCFCCGAGYDQRLNHVPSMLALGFYSEVETARDSIHGPVILSRPRRSRRGAALSSCHRSTGCLLPLCCGRSRQPPPRTRDFPIRRMTQARIVRDGRPVPIRDSVPDDVALIELRDFLERARAEGRERIGLLDLVADVALPPEHLRRLMESLSSEGVEEIE